MPRYMLRIGEGQTSFRFIERAVNAPTDREAMRLCIGALLKARKSDGPGSTYTHWWVSKYNPETRNYALIAQNTLE